MSASKYIPGLGTQFFIHPDHIKPDGNASKYIPGLGSAFKVAASEISEVGGAEKYIPGLGSQVFFDAQNDIEQA